MTTANAIRPLSDDAVVVVLSANDVYVPYVSALLQSLAETASPAHTYDILIMHTDISAEHRRALADQIARDSISLRFIDVTDEGAACAQLFMRGHFKVETYYRLLMPDILPQYSKVLYLDSDMIIRHDIAELFRIDPGENLLAAVKDADTAGAYNGYKKNYRHYLDDVLKLHNPYDYFQAGTILFNLDAFRATYTVEEMLELAASYDWILLDQDVLNMLAQGRVRFLDQKWNVITDWKGIRISDIISLAPADMREDYLAARKDPGIIHYAGPEKPWNDETSDMAGTFWEVAERTPFYEELLRRKDEYRRATSAPAFRIKQFILYGCLDPVVAALFPRGTKRRDRLEKLRPKR